MEGNSTWEQFVLMLVNVILQVVKKLNVTSIQILWLFAFESNWWASLKQVTFWRDLQQVVSCYVQPFLETHQTQWSLIGLVRYINTTEWQRLTWNFFSPTITKSSNKPHEIIASLHNFISCIYMKIQEEQQRENWKFLDLLIFLQ